MTVENLLDRFMFYPDKITYYDVNENIQDEVDLSEAPLDKFCSFVEKYGLYEIVEWKMYRYKNTFEVHIEMKG